MGRFFIAMSRNLLVRVGAAAVAVVALLGVVTGALPVSCFARGAISCSTTASGDAVQTPAEAQVQPQIAPVDVPIVVVKTKTVSLETTAPTITHNDLVAATFALLPPELLAPPAAKSTPPASPENSAPAVRVVKTTPIRVQQTQVATIDTPAVVAAESIAASSAPASPDEPVVQLPIAYANELSGPAPNTSSVQASSAEAVAEAEPSAPPPKAAPKSDSKHMVVTGQGANVRSSPTKGKSGVLFALAGGESVAVGEDIRGWLHVTDGKGRSGWVYQDFLR